MNQERTGKFISELRKQKGMTQKELAEQIGVSDKTISKWECGNSIPDISYLDALCNSLDVSVNELLSGERLSKESNRYDTGGAEAMAQFLDRTRRRRDTLLLLLRIRPVSEARAFRPEQGCTRHFI